VDVDFTGTAPVGYTYGDPVPDPTSVRVVGPEDTVARVRRVAARVQKGTDEGAIDRVVTLIPEDAQQRVVEGVEIRPAQARVRIGLKRLPATKYMLLSARIEGEPAPGYAVRTYEFEPRTVLVIGPPDLLSSRSSIDVPVDVTGVSGRGIVARPVTVTPPDGLRLQGDATVRVRLDVRPVDPAVGATPAAPTPTPAPRESRGAVATPAPAATPTPAAPARAAGTE
jgi:YbbR domain-containing protein